MVRYELTCNYGCLNGRKFRVALSNGISFPQNGDGNNERLASFYDNAYQRKHITIDEIVGRGHLRITPSSNYVAFHKIAKWFLIRRLQDYPEQNNQNHIEYTRVKPDRRYKSKATLTKP